MKRIQRKSLNLDLSGELLSAKFEHLQDNEDGTVEEINTTSISRCESCGRPVQIAEIRGACLNCHRLTCSICAGFCESCKRGPYCGACRSGFAVKNLCVCSQCQLVLQERLAYQDGLIERKISFEQVLAVCDAHLKLAQVLQHNKDRISTVFGKLAQLRAARDIRHLEQQLKRANRHGQNLLP